MPARAWANVLSVHATIEKNAYVKRLENRNLCALPGELKRVVHHGSPMTVLLALLKDAQNSEISLTGKNFGSAARAESQMQSEVR